MDNKMKISKKNNYWKNLLQKYKINIQNNLISDINNFCPLHISKAIKADLKLKKIIKSTIEYFSNKMVSITVEMILLITKTIYFAKYI